VVTLLAADPQMRTNLTDLDTAVLTEDLS